MFSPETTETRTNDFRLSKRSEDKVGGRRGLRERKWTGIITCFRSYCVLGIMTRTSRQVTQRASLFVAIAVIPIMNCKIDIISILQLGELRLPQSYLRSPS